MSNTGTYTYIPGEGLVKISDDVPRLARQVWMPKGDVKYYDKSARQWFHSKAEKRQWLNANKMREGGIITNPDKRWDGPTRNRTKPTLEQRAAKRRAQEWVQSQGGTAGLLNRLQQKG